MPLNDVLSAYFFYYFFFFSVHTSHWQQSSSHEPVADNVDLVGRLLECQITSFVLHGFIVVGGWRFGQHLAQTNHYYYYYLFGSASP